MRLHHDIWLLVCDAKKALLLKNVGDAVYPKLETRQIIEHAVHRSGAIASDAPGRAFSGAGGRKAAMDDGDPHLDEERNFLRTVSHHLEKRIEDGEIAEIIIVAPPRALGILREIESPHFKRVTRAELAHDYVKLPLYEIEKRLQSALEGH